MRARLNDQTILIYRRPVQEALSVCDRYRMGLCVEHSSRRKRRSDMSTAGSEDPGPLELLCPVVLRPPRAPSAPFRIFVARSLKISCSRIARAIYFSSNFDLACRKGRAK